MTRKTILIYFLGLFPLWAQKTKVDLILHHAKIYTLNPQNASHDCMLIKDQKVFLTGSYDQLKKKYYSTNEIDLGGKYVYPGFIDPHAHFLGYAQMLGQCDLVGTKSFDEILERLQVFSKNNPGDAWIIGRGWDQNDWSEKSFPTKDALDLLFPQKPVMLTRIDGHAMLVNSKALQLAKISPSTKINGGEVEVIDGQCTGILIDNAMGFVKRVVPPDDDKKKASLLKEAEKKCFEVGLTTISEAGINQEDIELIMELQKANTLKIRDYAMVSIGLRNIEYFSKRGIIKTPQMHVRSFKLYADGALGSRGAALIEPYADKPGSKGLMVLSAAEMDKYFAEIIKTKYQANTHCIGDQANRTVLDLYAKYLKGPNDRRWRIEHAQVVSLADQGKFGKYKIIPSVQSTHATSDMYWAEERLGSQRVKTAYAFKQLMKQNGLIANGSDFPVEDINPMFGFFAASIRKDAKMWPKNGFHMENALSRLEALKAMTLWAAYANFEEKEKGSLEPGKWADFVVLNHDILEVPAEKLRDTKVRMTFVGGQKVFEKK
jgi:predicted amidohydrolase YtcJ